MKRRNFLTKSLSVGVAGTIAPGLIRSAMAEPASAPTPRMVYDDISLAQWALVNEFKSRKITNLDFPKVAREDFDINGIEFVNTLFDSPTASYLNQLKRNAKDHDVKLVLIMVDGEGETCTPSVKARKQTVINHRKWIDIAQYLGCHSIRTNCRGPRNADKNEALKWAAETYNMMLEYAVEANIGVCIENHGGLSNDEEWMLKLMKEVDNKYFGSYPDWRSPSDEFDNFNFLKEMLPYAMGMSYRNQPSEEIAAKMVNLCKDSGYRGWYGIESSGREAIKEGIRVLKKYL